MEQDHAVIALSAFNRGESPAPSSVQLWRIREDGTITDTRSVVFPPPIAGQNNLPDGPLVIRDLVRLDDRHLIGAITDAASQLWVAWLAVDGSVERIVPVGERGREIYLARILRLADGRILLLGHESLDEIVVDLDVQGSVVWEETRDRGRMDLVADGIPLDDGGYVLVGNSGTFNMRATGSSTICVSAYSHDHRMEREACFPGMGGSIVRSSEGGFVIAYDVTEGDVQEVWIRFLSRNLRVTRSVKVFESDARFGPTKTLVVPVSNERYFAAGRRDGRPYSVILDADGEPVWQYYVDGANMSLANGLAVVGESTVWVFSAYEPDDNGAVVQKLHIIEVMKAP